MATYRKLGRNTAHRNLMLRNQVTDVLKYERIQTTETRAKETRRMVEKNDYAWKKRRSSCKKTSIGIYVG